MVKTFPDLSGNTIKKDLQLLVQQQMISKTGEKKGTVYMKLINK